MAPPNFLILQADQLTSEVLAAYGHPLAKTPEIDRLARRGTVFTNAYCSYPLCGPSRMSMLSGQLASRVGAYDNASEFSSEIPTFAHYLRARGYTTTLSGKMHFVGADQLHGFEHRLTTDIYPSDFYWTENLEDRDVKTRSDDRGVRISGICDRSPQLDFDELAMYQAEQHLFDLARRRNGPFCLFVSLTHPHDPYFCQQEHWDRYSDDEIPLPTVGRVPSQAQDPLSDFIMTRHDLNKDFDPALIIKARRAYLGSVSYIDDQLGRLVRILRRTGLSENTVVILLGDHGEMLGERGMWFKRHFYEWSARVPMVFAGPGIAAGQRAENVTLMDLLPTLLALSSDEGCSGLVEPITGRDLSGALKGGAPVEDVALAEVMSDGLAQPIFMIRRGDWKLMAGPAHPAQLYNLAEDPHEERDLGQIPGDHDAVRAAMQEEMAAIWDAEALQAAIDRSIARRMLIRKAHDHGQAPVWDYLAPPDTMERWCRTGSDYSAWAYSMLNPR
ncbi:MAG: choline-sulfatase [Pseudomonadota bacterium]